MKIIAAALLPALLSAGHPARAFSPVLPTGNDALFRGQPEKFYMYTDRDFEGVNSRPWQGGTYGFTRNPERLGGRVVTTKFHEGIDVAPLHRDASGEPLDDVRAIESGRVVHLSRDSKDSNYGQYLVIRHEVEGAPVFSIYSHLASIDVAPGENVARGARLGRLGYTGAGLNQRRAHLHLEIAILWHDQFASWHPANFPTPNKHGLYNGINLMGLDAAEFYLQQRKKTSLTLPRFIRQQDTFFRLQIPESPHFQLPRRYPWLLTSPAANTRSWIVSFTAAGFPVTIEPSTESLAGPPLVWAKPSPFPYKKVTRSLLDGPPGRPRLGASGVKLLSLLTWDPAGAPAPPTEAEP